MRSKRLPAGAGNAAWWLAVFIVTLGTAAFQRITGPARPVRGSVTIAQQSSSYKLPRTHAGDSDAVVSIAIPRGVVSGTLSYKRFKVDEPMKAVAMRLDGDRLSAALPHQPPAGKLEYHVRLTSGGETVNVPEDRYVVIRFKGHVSRWALVPHVVFIFLAMLCSTHAGIVALLNRPGLRPLAWWTLGLISLGGMLLGPLVQYQAFGAWWTGVPYGWDLTDNKTLVAFLLWLSACLALGVRRRDVSKTGRWLSLAAAVLTLAVFVIPHSVLGSELDYTKIDTTARPQRLGP
ncbi:MAG: hypothetical protein AB1714_10860 [Acidobacteriota bacterium]